MVEDSHNGEELRLISRVDKLSEEVRSLAFQLAWHLAKAKASPQGEPINRIESEFVRLVNSTVKVVQEVNAILSAAKNGAVMAFEPPSDSPGRGSVESRLGMIQALCSEILSQIRESGRVDHKY